MRRSPMPKLRRPGPQVAAVRPPDVAGSFATNCRSSSGVVHSCAECPYEREYLSGAVARALAYGKLKLASGSCSTNAAINGRSSASDDEVCKQDEFS